MFNYISSDINQTIDLKLYIGLCRKDYC